LAARTTDHVSFICRSPRVIVLSSGSVERATLHKSGLVDEEAGKGSRCGERVLTVGRCKTVGRELLRIETRKDGAKRLGEARKFGRMNDVKAEVGRDEKRVRCR